MAVVVVVVVVQQELVNDPHFYPMILWWWTPDSLLEKPKYKGAHWKFEPITLKPWTSECEVSRQRTFVPKFKTPYCEAGKYNLPSNWSKTCGTDCELSNCDYPVDILGKVVSQSIKEFSPDAFSFLSKVELTSAVTTDWLGQIDLNTTLSAMYTGTKGDNLKLRDVVCKWIRENSEEWRTWLPSTDTLLRTGCHKTMQQGKCSGHGICLDPRTKGGIGECTCDIGYAGDMCQTDVCNNYVQGVVGSGCSGHGACSGQVRTGGPRHRPPHFTHVRLLHACCTARQLLATFLWLSCSLGVHIPVSSLVE